MSTGVMEPSKEHILLKVLDDVTCMWFSGLLSCPPSTGVWLLTPWLVPLPLGVPSSLKMSSLFSSSTPWQKGLGRGTWAIPQQG